MQDQKVLSRLDELLAPAVVPVLTVARVGDALPLARALADGGLTTLEITLRTPTAISAIRAINEAMPEVAVGAGTVRSPEQAQTVIDAGAKFIVSPGMTPRLIEAAQRWPVPFLPGAATASEAMALADMGYGILKFFPAE
ncbi:MAG: keto-deoxy-phosphogluconate aldolase, partial [Hyphomicrobiaceae bacterium]